VIEAEGELYDDYERYDDNDRYGNDQYQRHYSQPYDRYEGSADFPRSMAEESFQEPDNHHFDSHERNCRHDADWEEVKDWISQLPLKLMEYEKY
jgi:hemolysin activation/secretion protein